ncbi:MAG: alpha/beta fold hydrolase [Candidatus Lokiarchaeota archaeon]|nr:alpha/beta fold hydrolase [Candidatus Lokiarchaeota archaeon]
MPRKKVNNIELYYEQYGEGDPLIMIMGLSANLDWWSPAFLDPIKKKYKIILFDNRDAGRSENVEKDYEIKDMATDIVELMEKLNIEKADILGISMGGMIAQELVLNYPDRVNKLILASTNCGTPKSILPSKKVMAELTKDRRGRGEEEIIEDFINLLYTDQFIGENPEFIKNVKIKMLKAPIKADAYKRQIKALLKFNTGRRLKDIKTPTLVIHGKKDILLPPKNSEIIANLLPNAELQYFENSGHALFSHEPEKSSEAVLKFLNK